jgi:MYXO-CTERM domain-containing protein
LKHLVVLAILLVGGRGMAAPGQIHLSWQGPTDTTMTVSWRSTASSGTVEYGPTAAHGQSVGASSTAYQGSYLHQAQITGLTPGTTYHYRCGTGGDWSSDSTFGTASNTGSYRYAAYGDSRSDDAARALVRAAVQARQPAFSVHTGDFVAHGNVQSQWDTWFSTMEPLLAVSPLMGAIGNHEELAPNYYAQFAFPSHTPATAVEGEAYYSFNYDTTHFIALSTEHDPKVGDPQHDWLKQDLIQAAKDPAIRWIVAFAHRPPYSSGTHGNNTAVQQAWSRLFESLGVDVTFWGHDHTYERSKPLFQGQTVSKGGVVYIVTGGAGAPLYTAKGDYFTAFCQKVYHFVEVNVQGTQMKLEARDTGGAVLDSLTLVKSGPKPKWIMDGSLDIGAQTMGTAAGPELKTLHAGFDGRYLYVATQGVPAVRDHFVLVADKPPTKLQGAPWDKAGQVWSPTAMLAMESSNGWSGWQDPSPGEAPIPFGSVWKYHDQGQDLGTAWLAESYDDSAWPSGPGQLGYGDGDESTTLTDADPNHPGAYFRKTFTLSQVPSSATLTVLHDDGFAVWINGQPVLSQYVADGTDYATWASSGSADNEQTVGSVTQGASGPFKQGTNVICAMVKQVNATSSDLSFDLELQLDPAQQTGFSSAANPAGPVMEGMLDLVERYGAVPQSVFLAAAAYGTKNNDPLVEQIPQGNANNDLELGEWVELKLAPPVPDGGADLGVGDAGGQADARRDAPAPGLDRGTTPDDGCSCTLASTPRGTPLLLLAVVLLFWRPRRRR